MLCTAVNHSFISRRYLLQWIMWGSVSTPVETHCSCLRYVAIGNQILNGMQNFPNICK
eukprot:SAG11_NODE_3848_length_2192_cov_1.253703_3_plen_58_part_00